MKVIAGDVERVHLVVGHLDAFRVLVGVAADLETCVGCRGADELDDDLMVSRIALSDGAESTIFDGLPASAYGVL